ncbi:MAG: N-acetylmuramoyl-L-alanine amidase [Candidatus Korobacteraceae bacterium]
MEGCYNQLSFYNFTGWPMWFSPKLLAAATRRERRHHTLSGSGPGSKAFAILILLLLTSTVLEAQSGSDRQLRVFAPQTTYDVPVLEHNGAAYVGLFETLEPLGRVESRIDQGRWKLTFAAPGSRSVEVEFTEGSSQGKLAGSAYELPSEFIILHERGLVPESSLGGVLPRLLGRQVQLKPGDRLLIGVAGFSFSQQLRRNPSQLVLSFPAPVNPMISTEPGNIHLTFTREPVMPPTAGGEHKFSDPIFKSSSAVSANGALQLTVNVTRPVMAAFSDSGRTITISPLPDTTPPAPQAAEKSAPQPASATPATAPAPAPAATATPPPGPPAAPSPPPPGPPNAAVAGAEKPVVVIDAAHGGSDSGAALPVKGSEKELTLEMARLIQRELQSRGLATLMLRTSDANLSLNQRASTANAARILAYISVHAAGEGHGVRLYTALLPPTSKAPARKQFLPWDKVQSSWLELSGSLAGSIAAELNQRRIEVRAMAMPLRPLNNIWAPAVAIEIAPQEAGKAINTGNYLRTIAASVSAGVAAINSKLEAAQ